MNDLRHFNTDNKMNIIYNITLVYTSFNNCLTLKPLDDDGLISQMISRFCFSVSVILVQTIKVTRSCVNAYHKNILYVKN